MLLEFLQSYFWVFILPLEIGLLFIFYKYYFAEFNATAWRERAREPDFLTDILSPVIDSITISTSETVIEKLKHEMLASQGTMARQIMSTNNIESPEDMMMHVSTSLLKSLGYTNPNPLLSIKLAQGLGVLAEKTLSSAKSSPEALNSLKTGQELLNEL